MSSPDIKVLLGADGVEQVLSAFRKVQKEVRETDKAAKQSTGGWGSLSKVAGEFSSGILPQLGALSAGTALAGVAVGLGAAIAKSIEFADSLNDMHDKTGIAVETLSQLAPVAELGGTSLESLVTIYGKFSAKMAAGDAGIKSLGLTTKDASQAMIQISEKMSKATTQTEKIAIAQKAYGKSWQEMMPILQAGPETLRSQMEKAAIVTTDMAEKSAKFKDTMTELKAPLMDITLELAQGIIPYMIEWAEGMKIILRSTKEWLGLNNKVEQSLANVSDQGVRNALINKNTEINAKRAEIESLRKEAASRGITNSEYVRFAQRDLDRLVKEAQQIDEVIKRRDEAKVARGDSGTSGGTSGGTKTAKTEAKKQVFDQSQFEKQFNEAMVALRKEGIAQELAVLDDAYKSGKVSAEAYYAAKTNMALESTAIQKSLVDSEIAQLEIKKNASTDEYAKAQLQLQINQLIYQQDLASAQLSGEIAGIERERAAAIAERGATELETSLKAQEQLAAQQKELRDSFEQGANQVLNKFLTDTIFNAKSASDAFGQFGMSVVSTMQQIMTQMLVMQAVKAMFGAFGGGMGPGNVMANSVIPFIGKAEGGIITGGTPGVDSVPVMAMPGEGVLRTSAMEKIGPDAFDDLNKGRAFVVPGRPLQRFAEGGIITGGKPGVDSVPIMSMPGEGILRTSAMSRIGASAFHDLNEGRAFVVRGRSIPRFADGGIVGGAGASAVEGGFGEAGLTVGLADGLVEQKIERWARGPVARRIQVEQLSKAPKSANQALGRTK